MDEFERLDEDSEEYCFQVLLTKAKKFIERTRTERQRSDYAASLGRSKVIPPALQVVVPPTKAKDK